jgi:hypothetical protein
MAKQPSRNSDSSFQTPNPKELQAPENKDAARESISRRQGEETEVVDPDDNFLQDDAEDKPNAGLRSLSAPD